MSVQFLFEIPSNCREKTAEKYPWGRYFLPHPVVFFSVFHVDWVASAVFEQAEADGRQRGRWIVDDSVETTRLSIKDTTALKEDRCCRHNFSPDYSGGRQVAELDMGRVGSVLFNVLIISILYEVVGFDRFIILYIIIIIIIMSVYLWMSHAAIQYNREIKYKK